MNKNKRGTLIGRVACIVIVLAFLPLLLVNLTLIIKGLIDEETPPDIFGYMPLAVTSGSMDDGSEDSIRLNDMIFVKKGDPQTYVKGDIITFRNGDDIITHRIAEVIRDSGSGKITHFSTKGDANNTTDGFIPVDKVYGRYESRVGGLGGFALFLKTPMGIVIFAGIPIAAFIIFEVVSIVQDKRRSASADEKDAEIERLRALVEAKNNTGDAPQEQSEPQNETAEPSQGEQTTNNDDP